MHTSSTANFLNNFILVSLYKHKNSKQTLWTSFVVWLCLFFLYFCAPPVSAIQNALHRVTAVVGWGGAGGGYQGLAGSFSQTGADHWTHDSHSVHRCLSSPGSGSAGIGPQGLSIGRWWGAVNTLNWVKFSEINTVLFNLTFIMIKTYSLEQEFSDKTRDSLSFQFEGPPWLSIWPLAKNKSRASDWNLFIYNLLRITVVNLRNCWESNCISEGKLLKKLKRQIKDQPKVNLKNNPRISSSCLFILVS